MEVGIYVRQLLGKKCIHIWFCDGKQFSPVTHPNRL